MKVLLAFTLIVILCFSNVAHASKQVTTSVVGINWEPIPHVCTRAERAAKICPLDYTPVLGVFSNRTWQVFGNGCFACATAGVRRHYPLNMCGINFTVGGPCTLEYFPVCGITKSGKLQEYGNSCGACSSGQVELYLVGRCPRLAGPRQPVK